ncbi:MULTISPECIES: 2TM domain-containing protein [unclassified Flavobacterium]|uniref:2TM domain-containing protein n=1 Tax=unclassified Flavobacterium TaxID=196869 RepID=UPI000EB17875|nr:MULTISPECIES: 2TM domain-containing protein [unclassified Flavobacterium]RKS02007.1 2TM domain-containing protein [Flavobacterium sp. 102]
MENLDEIKYQEAVKRVKKIKGFYTHAAVYVVINIILLIVNVQNSSEGIFRWENVTTPLFWGIGLVAHGFSVFMPTMIFGKDWEAKKIKELMEKEKKNKWE